MKSPAAFRQELDVDVAIRFIAESIESTNSTLCNVQRNSRQNDTSHRGMLARLARKIGHFLSTRERAGQIHFRYVAREQQVIFGVCPQNSAVVLASRSAGCREYP